MAETNWVKAIETMRQYAFKIKTPSGSGTGFLLTLPNMQGLYGVATAYHVVDHANEWEEPIKLIHEPTKKSLLLRAPHRFIFKNPKRDVAVILFGSNDFDLPSEELRLGVIGKYLFPGGRVAWVGYPSVAPDNFSFFSGTVSCFLHEESAYLVDGVVIHGVSGGPAFWLDLKDTIYVIGVVTHYLPNVASGDLLPGVGFVSDVGYFHSVVKGLKTFNEAREKAEEIEEEQSLSSKSDSSQT